MPRDGLCKIAVRLLDQKTIGEIQNVAMEGKLVGVAAGALKLARKAKQIRGLTYEIERDIGE